MTYYGLVKKQLFSFLLLSLVTIATYYIANIWGMGNPIVQSKNFIWIVAGATFAYLFIVPLTMLFSRANGQRT